MNKHKNTSKKEKQQDKTQSEKREIKTKRALLSKAFQQKGTQKLLLGCQKRRDIFAGKKKERTAKKKVVRKT